MKIVPLRLEELSLPNGKSHWFCADLHLGHANLIKYCSRPFANINEMDDTIIGNINDNVKEDNFLYILGDFAIWYDKDKKPTHEIFREYRQRINCRNVYLILGNHDPHYENYTPKPELSTIFKQVSPVLRVKIDGIKIYLHHFACRVWPGSHRQFHKITKLPTPSWHLYGHSHGGLPDDPHSLSFDVGVDCHNFKPLNVNDIVEIMSKKEWIRYTDED